MEQEQWKPVRGFEGVYEVSSHGRVRSLPRDYGYGSIKEPSFLKQNINRGYARVTLYRNGRRHQYQVHLLVAEAFVPNPEKKPFVNHKDEVRTNNYASNLMWCTAKENINWGNCRDKISAGVSKPVVQLSKTGEFIREWPSMTEASRTLGISLSEISKCTRTPGHTAGGYKWRKVQ